MKEFTRQARGALVLLGIGLALMLIFRLNRQIARLQSLQREEARLHTEVAAITATVQALEMQLTEAASDARVERWAHGEAHWVKEGEVLVVPQPVGTPEVDLSPPAVASPTPPARWMLWWMLFFGPPRSW